MVSNDLSMSLGAANMPLLVRHALVWTRPCGLSLVWQRSFRISPQSESSCCWVPEQPPVTSFQLIHVRAPPWPPSTRRVLQLYWKQPQVYHLWKKWTRRLDGNTWRFPRSLCRPNLLHLPKTLKHQRCLGAFTPHQKFQIDPDHQA